MKITPRQHRLNASARERDACANAELKAWIDEAPAKTQKAWRGASEAEIMAARSPRGAWTAKTLRQWGVPWPPPKGWKRRLIAQYKLHRWERI
jgi:hypothetical protein